MKKVLIAGVAMLALNGCSQSVQGYQQQQPTLDIRQFFSGQGEAFGVMHNWRGEQTLHFTARLCGVWRGDTGDLYEIFHFSDGRIDKRRWQLTLSGAGHIRGTAADVIGEALGEFAGNSMQFRYQLRIPQVDGSVDVNVDDWMYLVSPTQLINRSSLSKFGVEVGQLTLAIQQTNAAADCTTFIKEFAQTQVSPPTP